MQDSQLIVVRGGNPISGDVTIGGAKNSALKLMAASVMAAAEVRLDNVPCISDVQVMGDVLRVLGASVRPSAKDPHTLVIDTAPVASWETPYELVAKMRASISILGPLIARFGCARVAMPGGCQIGARKLDMHITSLEALGVQFKTDHGFIEASTPQGLHGAEVVLDFPSVGATENILLAAVTAKGKTTLRNAAREPEIVDLQNYLRACGAEVSGAGTDQVSVTGKRPLHDCTYTVMPDRIAAATYLCAAASAGGEVRLLGARERHLSTVTAALREAGCTVTGDSGGITCRAPERLRSVSPVRTAPYPGFPTDAQAVLMAALLRSRGTTVFEENIFTSRYRHVDELIRMGGSIQVSGRVAVVTGVERLHGACVRSTDLRGGAALCVAALAAEGVSQVENISHIDRGYEDLARDLESLGAKILREET